MLKFTDLYIYIININNAIQQNLVRVQIALDYKCTISLDYSLHLYPCLDYDSAYNAEFFPKIREKYHWPVRRMNY